jgi:SAM-dependent methyltransferase
LIASIPTSVRFWARGILYRVLGGTGVQLLKRAAGAADVHDDPAYWNAELSGRLAAPNLNGQVSNAVRHATTAELIRLCAPAAGAVLDVGCGYCELARGPVGDGLTRYVGVDLSDYAITQAKREPWPCRADFHAADLREFTSGESFDVVVFNEVLKYLDVDEARAQVGRYATWLNDDGVIVVTLTDDVKCRAIFGELAHRFAWIHGSVFQARPDGPRFRVTRSRATPAYLVGVFGPRESKST